MRRERSPIQDLRRAIDCLPLHTREAMLQGIDANEIIVGAYSDRDGGVCPMLAAHRLGGRTSFITFARAWDRFAGAKRARRASAREVGVLRAHLQAGLVEEAPAADLGGAIAEHQAGARDRRAREARESGGWGVLAARRRDQAAAGALERESELV